MNISKENIMKAIEEVNSKRIDIRKTIEKAAEFEGEKGVAIFKNNSCPIDYDRFAAKKKYKFDFLSERFFKIMNRYYISNKGIFLTLARGYDKYTANHGPEDYTIRTLSGEYGFSSDETHYIASQFGIKITEIEGVQKVEFGCMFGAHACGYGGVWVFQLIDEWGNDFNYNSLNNPVNQAAIRMMVDEIVFEEQL